MKVNTQIDNYFEQGMKPFLYIREMERKMTMVLQAQHSQYLLGLKHN